MRYRIPIILATATALIGLSASAAFAGPRQLTQASCSGQTQPAYHIMANANKSAGITYHGEGNQATVTTSPGDSTLEWAGCAGSVAVYVIHNDADNCLRMHDASSGYGIYEEENCELNNTEEWWVWSYDPNTELSQFYNYYWGLYLGVTCPASNGTGLRGQTGLSGTCTSWLLEPH
jgi:hypothetical protein